MNKTSACLSALLAASLTPMSGNAATGTMNYPLSAQKALQTALSGLDASGWPAAAAATSVAQPMPTTARSTPSKADPIPAEEWIARLLKFMEGFKNDSTLSKKTCHVLNLCDGTADMPLKLAKADTATDGAEHWFGLPLKEGSKDILILRTTADGVIESYLIDKTGKLRAAAVQTNGSARLITKEQAAEKFKKEMALFGREASELPPTGTAVADK